MEEFRGFLPDLTQIEDIQPGAQMDQIFDRYNPLVYQANINGNQNAVQNEFGEYLNAIRQFQEKRLQDSNNINQFLRIYPTQKQQEGQLIANSLVGITNKYLWMATNKDSIALTNLRNMLARPYAMAGVDKGQVRQRQLKFLQKMQTARDQAQQVADQVINSKNFTKDELGLLGEISRLHGRQLSKIQSSTDDIRQLNFIQDSSTASFFAAKAIRENANIEDLVNITKKFLTIHPENLKKLSDYKEQFNKNFGKIIGDEMNDIKFNPRQPIQPPLKLEDFINQGTFLDQITENDYISPAAVRNVLQNNKNYVPSTEQVLIRGNTEQEKKENIYNQFSDIVRTASDDQMLKYIKKFQEEPLKYAMPLVYQNKDIDERVYQNVYEAIRGKENTMQKRFKTIYKELNDEQQEFFEVYFNLDTDTKELTEGTTYEELSKKIVDLVINQTDYPQMYQKSIELKQRPPGILNEFTRIKNLKLRGETYELPVLASGQIVATPQQQEIYKRQRVLDNLIAQGLTIARQGVQSGNNETLQKGLYQVANAYFEKNPRQNRQSYFASVNDYEQLMNNLETESVQIYNPVQMDWGSYEPPQEVEIFEEEKNEMMINQVSNEDQMKIKQTANDLQIMWNEMQEQKSQLMEATNNYVKLFKKQDKYKNKLDRLSERASIQIQQNPPGPITVGQPNINVAPPAITINNAAQPQIQLPPNQDRVLITNNIPQIDMEGTRMQLQNMNEDFKGFSNYFRDQMNGLSQSIQENARNPVDVKEIQRMNDEIQYKLGIIERGTKQKEVQKELKEVNILLQRLNDRVVNDDWGGQGIKQSMSKIEKEFKKVGDTFKRYDPNGFQKNKKDIEQATQDLRGTYDKILESQTDMKTKFNQTQEAMKDFLKKVENRDLQSAEQFIRNKQQTVYNIFEDYKQIFEDAIEKKMKFERDVIVSSDEQVKLISMTSKKLEDVGQKAFNIGKKIRDKLEDMMRENEMRENDDIIDVFEYETEIKKAQRDYDEIRNEADMAIQMANILQDPNVAIINQDKAQKVMKEAQDQIQKVIVMRKSIDERIKKGIVLTNEEREEYVTQYTIAATRVMAGQGFKGIYNTMGQGMALDQLQKELVDTAKKSNSAEYGKIIDILEDQKIFRSGMGQQMDSNEYMQILRGMPKDFIDENLKLRKNDGTNQRNVRIAAEMVGQLMKLSPEAVQNEELKGKELEGNAFKDFMKAVLQSDDKIAFMEKIEKILLDQGKIPTEALLAKITGKYVKELRDETLDLFKDKVNMDLYKAYGAMDPSDGILMMMRQGRLPIEMRSKLRLNLAPDQALLREHDQIYSENVERNIEIMNALLDARTAEERNNIKERARIQRSDEENVNSIYGLGRILQGATTLETVQEARRLRQEHQKQFLDNPIVKGQLFSQEQADKIMEKMSKDLGMRSDSIDNLTEELVRYHSEFMAYYQNSIDNKKIPQQEVLAHLHALPFFVDAVIKDQRIKHEQRQEEIKERERGRNRSMIDDAIMLDEDEDYEYYRKMERLELLRGEMLRQQTQLTVDVQNLIEQKEDEFNQAVLSEEKKATQIKQTMEKVQFEKKVAEERRLFDLKLSNERANIQLEQDKQAALNPGFFGGPGGKISAAQYATQQQKAIGNLNKGGKGTLTSGVKRSAGGAVVSDVKQDVTGEGQKKVKQEGFKQIQKDFTSQQQKLVKEIFFDKKKQKLLKKNEETGEVHELTQEERSFLADTFSKIFSTVFSHYLSALASSKQEQVKMDITSALFGEESKQEEVIRVINSVLEKVKENKVNQEDMNKEIARIHEIAKGKKEKKEKKEKQEKDEQQNQQNQ